MTTLTCTSLDDVEARNEAFARQHDIDEYYTHSSLLIRWIESLRLRTIRRLIDARPGHRILEVGCGGGHVLRLFPECELTGVDVCDRMLAKARRNLDGYRVRLLKGQLHELDLPPACFDRVICTEVLEHTVDPDSVLAGIGSLMRRDGRAVITFPNDHLIHAGKRWLSRTGLGRLPVFGRVAWGGDEYHLHVWNTAEMRALLASHFTIARERFVPSRLLAVRCCFDCRVP